MTWKVSIPNIRVLAEFDRQIAVHEAVLMDDILMDASIKQSAVQIAWLDERAIKYKIEVDSTKMSNLMQVTFVFDTAMDASMFRLKFG